MSGLTTYPRTHGGTGPSIRRFRDALRRLRLAKANLVEIAEYLADELQKLSVAVDSKNSGISDADVVTFARETREVLVDTIHLERQLKDSLMVSMEICAKHWIKDHPLESTNLKPLADRAISDYNKAQSSKELSKAHEIAGTVAALYHISTLLGEDISKTITANATLIGNSKSVGTKDSANTYIHLEPASSYNINVFIMIKSSVTGDSFIFVAEAKGGASNYGHVNGPASMENEYPGCFPLSQKDALYAYSRAEYMAGCKGISPANSARKEVGLAIKSAIKRGQFAYITARGKISKNQLIANRESFQCL